jgi:hypothetical protein
METVEKENHMKLLTLLPVLALAMFGVRAHAQGYPGHEQCHTEPDGRYVCPPGQYPRYRAPLPDATFHGDACTTPECSGHQAGYAWARRKGITDPGQCSGKSQSFVDGCIAYAEGR